MDGWHTTGAAWKEECMVTPPSEQTPELETDRMQSTDLQKAQPGANGLAGWSEI